MAFPPTPITLGALATSTYINTANADAATRFTAVETTANASATSIAAAANVANSGSLVKWGASGAGITPPAGTLLRNAIREFGAYASGPISTVVNYTGGVFTDYTVATPTARFLASGTTSHAAPTAGLERLDCVSMSLGVATPGVSVALGTPAAFGTAGYASPANAGDEVLYYVYTKAGMAGIKDVADGTNGYIIPVALHNFRGGSGGGGGGGTLTNAVLGIGAGTPTNIVPLLRGDATLGTVNSVNLDATDPSGMPTYKGWGGLRTGGANDGSLADTLRDYYADAASRVYLQSNAVHYSAAAWLPGTIVINGRSRTVTAEPTPATASGAAGQRFAVADLSGTGPGFTLVSPMPNVDTSSETGYKKALAIFEWDGAALHLMADSVYDSSPLATIPSHQVTPTLFNLPAGSTTNDTLTASDAVLNGMSGVLTLTKPSRVRFTGILGYSGTGTPGTYTAIFTLFITGGPNAPGAITSYAAIAQQTGTATGSVPIVTNRIQLQAGQYTVALHGQMSNAAAAFTVFGNTKFLEAEVGN